MKVEINDDLMQALIADLESRKKGSRGTDVLDFEKLIEDCRAGNPEPMELAHFLMRQAGFLSSNMYGYVCDWEAELH